MIPVATNNTDSPLLTAVAPARETSFAVLTIVAHLLHIMSPECVGLNGHELLKNLALDLDQDSKTLSEFVLEHYSDLHLYARGLHAFVHLNLCLQSPLRRSDSPNSRQARSIMDIIDPQQLLIDLESLRNSCTAILE